MCGISGFISPTDHTHDLLESLSSISHRGPDDSDHLIKRLKKENIYIGLGFRRLSIIDLSQNGSQPMSKDGVTICLNGEIYNYKNLKKTHELDKSRFSSDTDTEVALELYLKYGESAFRLLCGMFAITLIDFNKNKVYFLRDHLGIKPLYYYQNKNDLFFCSEIRGLSNYRNFRKEIDSFKLYEFLRNGFLFDPNTGFKGLKKVPISSLIEIDIASGRNFKPEITKIDFYKDMPKSQTIDFALEKIIKKQENADVNKALFYSGGIDSSVIGANTDIPFLNINYDEKKSNKRNLKNVFDKAVAKGKKIEFKKINKETYLSEDPIKVIDKVVEGNEELISDLTYFSTQVLADIARKSGYSVVLSGTGGDELFFGYHRYLIVKYRSIFRMLYPLILFFSKFKLIKVKYGNSIFRLLAYLKEDPDYGYQNLVGYFSEKELATLIPDSRKAQEKEKIFFDNLFKKKTISLLEKASSIDRIGFLQHNLIVADKASMSQSIELRVPLLDEILVRYSSESFKIKRNKLYKKELRNYLSRSSMKNSYLKEKVGFNPSLDDFISTISKENILENCYPLKPYLNYEAIIKIVNDHFNSRINNSYKIWQLLYLARWIELNKNPIN